MCDINKIINENRENIINENRENRERRYFRLLD